MDTKEYIDLYYIGCKGSTLYKRAKYTINDAINRKFDSILFIEVTEGREFIQSGAYRRAGCNDGLYVGSWCQEASEGKPFYVTLPILKKGCGVNEYKFRSKDYLLGYVEGVLSSTLSNFKGFYWNFESIAQFTISAFGLRDLANAVSNLVFDYDLELIWIPATLGMPVSQLRVLDLESALQYFTKVFFQPNYYMRYRTYDGKPYTYDKLVELVEYVTTLSPFSYIEFEADVRVLNKNERDIRIKRACDYIKALKDLGIKQKVRAYYHDVDIKVVDVVRSKCPNW